MRNNITALQHPTIKRKIRRALWLAKLECLKEQRDGNPFACGRQYVQNRHGHNIMRVDYWPLTGIKVWGDQSRNITSMVVAALGL